MFILCYSGFEGGDGKMKKMKINIKRFTDLTILLCMDTAAFAAALSASICWVYGPKVGQVISEHPDFVILIAGVTFLSLYLFDLYYTFKDFRRYRQVVNLAMSMAVSCIFMRFISDPINRRWMIPG